ncbi:MAG: alpha/beta hydrolase [Myxococcales bacterium]|nr:alpha/beta hydrolase [Myxococcales bacterium]
MTTRDVREIDLGPGRIRYRERGAGAPLVFVHGLLADGRLWDPAAEILARRHRCILPDWPLGSHVLPMRADADLTPGGVADLIAAFLDALDLRDVTLVGVDSGGALSQIVATTHPGRLGRLVLGPCDAFDNFPPKLFGYLKVVARSPWLFGPMRLVMPPALASRMPLAYGWVTKRPIATDLIRDWLAPSASPEIRRDLTKFILGTSPRYTEEAARRLAAFDKPLLLAWAPEDKFFPIAHGRRLAEIAPKATLVEIPGARTFVSLDQPERFARAIEAFVG